MVRADVDRRLRDALASKPDPAQPVWRGAPGLLTEKVVFAVVGGTTIEKSLIDGLKARRIEVTVAPVADYATGLQMVRDRRAAAFFGDRPVLLDAAKRGPAAGDLLVIDRVFTREPLALAMQRGDDDFRLTVDRSLSRLFRSHGHRRRSTPATSARRTPVRWSSSSRSPCRTDELPDADSARSRETPHADSGRSQRSRQAADRDGLPAGPGASAPDARATAADLLFDDVLWVHEAQKDHYDFVLKMRERGIEVLDLHEMLAETLEDKAARDWVLDRRITDNDVGIGSPPR